MLVQVVLCPAPHRLGEKRGKPPGEGGKTSIQPGTCLPSIPPEISAAERMCTFQPSTSGTRLILRKRRSRSSSFSCFESGRRQHGKVAAWRQRERGHAVCRRIPTCKPHGFQLLGPFAGGKGDGIDHGPADRAAAGLIHPKNTAFGQAFGRNPVLDNLATLPQGKDGTGRSRSAQATTRGELQHTLTSLWRLRSCACSRVIASKGSLAAVSGVSSCRIPTGSAWSTAAARSSSAWDSSSLAGPGKSSSSSSNAERRAGSLPPGRCRGDLRPRDTVGKGG